MNDNRTIRANFSTVPTETTFDAVSRSIPYNTSASLIWSSNDAINCRALAGPGFSTGDRASGIDASNRLTEHTSFTVRCYGPHPYDGPDSQKTIEVRVRAPEPKIDKFEIDPLWVRSGNSTMLSWEVQNSEVDDVTTTCTVFRDDIPIPGLAITLTGSKEEWSPEAYEVENIEKVTKLKITCQSEKPGNLDPSSVVSRELKAYVLPIYKEF